MGTELHPVVALAGHVLCSAGGFLLVALALKFL